MHERIVVSLLLVAYECDLCSRKFEQNKLWPDNLRPEDLSRLPLCGTALHEVQPVKFIATSIDPGEFKFRTVVGLMML